uniref:Uncharacterized protein n=1 Tax=Timema cristinae TaxID=61476 RepID=A0A7R9D4Q1_TIMCR|nr:unnamed protein product [Timema cristinae]
MSKRGTYTSLTLAKKVEVIREVEKRVKKKCDITKEYEIQPGPEGVLWKEGADSSGSETGKQDLEEDVQNHPTEHRNSSGNVKFTVGGDSWAEDGRGSNVRGSQRVSMIRCVSQDTGMMLGARDPSLSKSSLSETHLVEQGVPRAPSSGSGRKHSSREHTHQFQHQATVEEEQYSTDSNSTTDDDVRRRKRKLFSGFPRKPKAS